MHRRPVARRSAGWSGADPAVLERLDGDRLREERPYMNLTYRQMTVENAITMERLESDYGVTPQSLVESMAGGVKGRRVRGDGVFVLDRGGLGGGRAR